jgi:hypothetical protein
MQKRAKSIKIRVSEDELTAMRERCDRPQLADWLRDLALGESKRRPVPKADPELLRQLITRLNGLESLYARSFKK